MSALLAGGSIFLSAFLLFQLQPMVAKAILPWFGGSAAVWGTCLMFFQVVLFLGYLYAHWLTKVPARKQVWVHGALLLASVFVLPVLPGDGWKPGGEQEPIGRILLLLTATVGLPYFLLSSTSPLMQSWYARTQGALPYRYFALSNAASLAALLGYPVLVEPYVALRTQGWVWGAAYVAYAGLCGWSAWVASRAEAPEPQPVVGQDEHAAPVGRTPGWGDRLLWMMLAGLASVMSLSVTNHISQNVAPIPMLWVLPLAAYLITFIVCFESDRWYTHLRGSILHGAALVGMGYLLTMQTPETNIRLVVPALLAGLFACCLFFHGELARRKPSSEHLTEFYLMLALGGALGAIVVGLAAPLVLAGPYELAVAVAAAGFVTMLMEYRKSLVTDVVWAAVAVGVVVAARAQVLSYQAPAKIQERNFYGTLRVVESEGRRMMIHGIISHGSQFLDAERRGMATAYYAPGTGVERAIEARRRAGERVGVIGLGVGTIAAYGRAGDVYRFYEINPRVLALAEQEFRFLKDSGAEVSTVIGDGRLSLEREPDQDFDVLAIDAFSGDSVPVHLLSREAMQIYMRHLRPDGVLAFHVSNSALSLASVVKRLADDQGYTTLRVSSKLNAKLGRSESDWMLVSRNQDAFEQAEFQGLGSGEPYVAGLKPWTDDYSTLYPILK